MRAPGELCYELARLATDGYEASVDTQSSIGLSDPARRVPMSATRSYGNRKTREFERLQNARKHTPSDQP